MKTRSTSRFRPNSKAWVAALVLALTPLGLSAQQVSPILTIDRDRLLAETQAGSETIAELERLAQALAAENSEIEDALIAEESALTEQRATLKPEEFRALADAFDARVQQLRAEQDEKARLLNRQRDEAPAQFFNEVAPILSEIVREKGAVVVIDLRQVFLSVRGIDITDEAIARINAERSASE